MDAESQPICQHGGFVPRKFVPEKTGERNDTKHQTQPEKEENDIDACTPHDASGTSNGGNVSRECNAAIEVTTRFRGDFSLSEFMTPYHLNAKDISILREKAVLPRLPFISPGELQDWSKADSFMRLITVGQILWVCIQAIVRATRDLPVSQLEISVVAFACCAILMY